jgi:pyruvate dehydrogenase E1 component alpha subunit
VAVCFFGDGALNIGPFHESLNLAGLWSLPVVYVCENNMYGMSTHWRKAAGIERIDRRAESYNMAGMTVDGMDVEAAYDAAGEAIGRARQGNGPTLLVMETYRYYGHSRTDPCNYRTKEEEAAWKRRDPIRTFRARLIHEGLLDDGAFERMEAEVTAQIDDAVAFAEGSPYPTREDLETDVYCEGAPSRP